MDFLRKLVFLYWFLNIFILLIKLGWHWDWNFVFDTDVFELDPYGYIEKHLQILAGSPKN